MTEQPAIPSPSRRLDLQKELTFQRETIKLRKAFLNVYTFELFYRKNLKLKNNCLKIIKREDAKMRSNFQDRETSPREMSLQKRLNCINHEFTKTHHVKGYYHVDALELNRHVCFLEKETMNRFLFSLRIDGSNYSFDDEDTYLYWLFVRFVRCIQFCRRHFGKRKHNTIIRMSKKREISPLFCDARYVKKFCAFIAPFLKRNRGNPHFTFLKEHLHSLGFTHMTKSNGRDKNSSCPRFLRYSIHVGTLPSDHKKGISRRRKNSPTNYMVLPICMGYPTYNLSIHRKRIGTFPLSVHGEYLKCRQEKIKVNGTKISYTIRRFVSGQLYENLLNSIFNSLVSKNGFFKWNSFCEDIGRIFHSCEEKDKNEEAFFSRKKFHVEGSSFEMREPKQSDISDCLKVFFRPVHKYHRMDARDELIFLQNYIRNLLQEDVRKLLHMTVVNIALLCEHLPLGYLFPLFLFYFLFLNIPVGSSKTGRADFSLHFQSTNPKQRNCEGPNHNDQCADRCSNPSRVEANGVKDTERCFTTCLLCLYHTLRRNKKMTPLEKKKRLVFIVLDTLRKYYVDPIDQEESILSLHFRSVVNSACILREGQMHLISFKEGKGDEGNIHHCPVVCRACGRYNNGKCIKLREGKRTNSVKTGKRSRCHDVQGIFRLCFQQLNRKDSILNHLGELINPKGKEGGENKKKIAWNCNTYSPPCELYSIPSRSERNGQSDRCFSRGITSKKNNPSSRFRKKRDENSIVKKIHQLGAFHQLEDKQRVFLHQDNFLHEYLHTEGKTFLENLKRFLRPLLSALYRESIVHVNMYFYLCMVQSFLTLRRREISPRCMNRKGRVALVTQTRTVARTTSVNRHFPRIYQRGWFCKPVEDYLTCKFHRALHLLCTHSGSISIAKRGLRGITSYLQNSVKNLNVWLLLLVYRLANAMDVHTFVGGTSPGVMSNMNRGINLSLHRRSNIHSQRIRISESDKMNTKQKHRRNIRPYIQRLLKSGSIQNYHLYEDWEGDCFYIQRKKNLVIFNLRSKEGERNLVDSPNVYYRFHGKNYFVHEKDYKTRRAYKINYVNVCLLFYRYCFFFYKRNPLVFSFLRNRVFCVCNRCFGRYLVLCRDSNCDTPPMEDKTHDCFYKQIGMLIKNRKNIFVRYFHFLVLFLIMRYHTLVGNVRHSGLQSCVPKRVMTLLRRKLKIRHECFSSPLNAVLPSYCSFFPDIDTFFGSSGNFFEFPLRSGAYEVNPPFDVYLINQLIVYILHHLKKEENELTFFLVIPMLQDKNYFFELLFGSPYLSAHFLLPRNSYTFSTRLLESREEEYISTCDCFVFILQNEKAKIQKGVINKKVVLKIKKTWENLSYVKQKKKKKGISSTDGWIHYEESDSSWEFTRCV
ncbi:phosphorylated CTD interacting factor 1 WW domain-containing protein, putative [Plasmodium knowlesi strain H]|uniref:Phosphorylated CTD interacting factor 1 WW domain-containing protein, putative n=2 Tax=Plasmodium knowlesi (strain H) TaxID=5851 RepID=A0A679L2U5_PLAKH|nr:phosphorylated CTD interacting factor 1 WW domain-containing protein, putative [Plasmodium knowlesi strain H]CAA9990200.1 phosphorylated CTD interacting factor 1 WW domain-containing protein, putative [Plasmodium knowlesi strain H]SBO28476.1 conserved Plasmodium protein, unknown function [Plasmodium knowlesi strain H]VVS79674.1 phosphorylated CTD interacting factor 1 WW domain-containing protein, putative [Plasmodium knowlesi strain H]